MANGNNNGRKNTLSPEELESALALTGFDPETIAASYSRAAQTYEELYGDRVTEWTPAQEAMRQSALGRFQEISEPAPRPQPISRGPASEFSLDVGGLHSGLINLVGGYQEKKRREELYGDPEVQGEIMSQMTELKGRADQLRTMAQQVEDGELPGEAMRYMDADDVFRPESVKEKIQAEASEIDSQVNQLSQRLQAEGGVQARAESLTEQKEKVQTEQNFRQEFIDTFGAQGAEAVQEYMSNLRQDTRQAEREEARDERLAERWEERDQRIRNRQIEMFRIEQDAEDPNTDAPSLIESRLRPETVKVAVDYVRGELKAEIEKAKEEAKAEMGGADLTSGTIDMSEFPEKQERIMEAQKALSWVNDIEFAADRWATLEFPDGELPPKAAPTTEQRRLIRDMSNSSFIAPEMVEAYMEYNRIDLNAAPQPIAPPGEAPGDYRLPAPAGGQQSGGFQQGRGPLRNQNQDEE